jgi:hypothetical protein
MYYNLKLIAKNRKLEMLLSFEFLLFFRFQQIIEHHPEGVKGL